MMKLSTMIILFLSFGAWANQTLDQCWISARLVREGRIEIINGCSGERPQIIEKGNAQEVSIDDLIGISRGLVLGGYTQGPCDTAVANERVTVSTNTGTYFAYRAHKNAIKCAYFKFTQE